ncbi:LPXTG cell wall anchor domain-containing protein [Nonomuraea sp. NPDC046570]|uniref:LPXTG cell wall anchor domain-containing protein n=1 Tax=Nonomuraea sp. NPDC046570 TaxID=3155255 RepID=UPI0033FC412D
MSVPLAREVAVGKRQVEAAERVDLVSGPQGLPLAAGGIGVLLAGLWLVVRRKRRQIQDASQPML